MGDDSAATLAKQTGITLAGNVVGKAMNFGFVVAVTRLVDPSKYGVYVLAFSVVTLLKSVSNLGLNHAIDYYVPSQLQRGDHVAARSIVVTVVVATLVGGSAVAVVLIFAAPWISGQFSEPALAAPLAICALAIPLLALQSVANALFVATKQMQYVQLTQNVVRPIVKIVGAVALVVLGYGVTGIVVGHLAAMFLAVALAAGLSITRFDWLRDRTLSTIPSREMASYSIPLVFTGVIFGVVGQLDFFFIGYFGGTDDVGVYRVAYLLAANVVVFHNSLTPVFKPMIVEVRNDATEMTERYLLATRWVAMVTLPVATAMLVLPETYLSLIFRPEYGRAALALMILVVGQVLNAAVGPTGRILQATGHTRIFLFNTLVLVTVNAGLNAILVPIYGLTGAAVATATALTATGAVALLEVWHFWRVHPFHSRLGRTWVAILPGAVAGMTIAAVTPDTVAIFLVPPIVAGVYYAALRLLRAFTETDAAVARRIDGRIGHRLIEPLVQ